MKWLWSVCLVFACAVAFGGCATPSLHGLHSDDVAVDDPGLVGVWTDGDTVARVERTAPGRFVVDALVTGATDGPRAVRLEAALVELDGVRFADLRPESATRGDLDERYVGTAVATHQFVKLRRRGDALTLWVPREAPLLAGVAHTTLVHEAKATQTILVAETPQLQRWFAAHARDADAFDTPIVLRRAP